MSRSWVVFVLLIGSQAEEPPESSIRMLAGCFDAARSLLIAMVRCGRESNAGVRRAPQLSRTPACDARRLAQRIGESAALRRHRG
jgi:hypothetical protein